MVKVIEDISSESPFIENLRNVIEPFVVMHTLSQSNFNFKEDPRDSLMYDGWDPNSPYVHSFIITTSSVKQNGLFFKACANDRDKEYILEIEEHQNYEVSLFLAEFYELNKRHKRSEMSVRFYNYGDNKYGKKGYEFSLYCSNEKIYFDLLKQCLKIIKI
jgi:hypothetical protein